MLTPRDRLIALAKWAFTVPIFGMIILWFIVKYVLNIKRLNNCMTYAMGLWVKRGGYIAVRRSTHLWVPHFLWIPYVDECEQYVPANPPPPNYLKGEPLFFEGKIETKDLAP